MKKIITYSSAVLVLLGLAAACAKQPTTSSKVSAKEYFDAWMLVNHPDAEPTPLGAYVIEETEGDGRLAGDADESPYLLVSYVVRDLDGTITDFMLEQKHERALRPVVSKTVCRTRPRSSVENRPESTEHISAALSHIGSHLARSAFIASSRFKISSAEKAGLRWRENFGKSAALASPPSAPKPLTARKSKSSIRISPVKNKYKKRARHTARPG